MFTDNDTNIYINLIVETKKYLNYVEQSIYKNVHKQYFNFYNVLSVALKFENIIKIKFKKIFKHSQNEKKSQKHSDTFKLNKFKINNCFFLSTVSSASFTLSYKIVKNSFIFTALLIITN